MRTIAFLIVLLTASIASAADEIPKVKTGKILVQCQAYVPYPKECKALDDEDTQIKKNKLFLECTPNANYDKIDCFEPNKK